MKDFRRSTAGKTLLILALMLCLAVTVTSAAGVWLLLDEGMYRMLPEEIEAQVLPDSIRKEAISAATSLWTGNKEPAHTEGVELRIIDMADGTVLYESSGFAAAEGSAEYFCGIGNVGGGIMFVPHFDGINENICAVTVRADRNAIRLTDEEAVAIRMIRLLYELRFAIYPITAAAVLLCILLLVALCCVSGHRPGTDAVFPGPLHIIPFDVLTALTALTVPFPIMLIDSMDLGSLELAAFLFLTVLYTAAAVGLLMSAAARAKLGTLIRSTLIIQAGSLIVRFVKWLFGALRVIPAVWRIALFVPAFTLVELIINFAADDPGIALFCEILLRIPVYAALLYAAASMTRLKKGADRLADGDYETKVSVKGMTSDFKAHAESLNRAADGMRKAVQNELKSERMKTALITNVSHDIKTPLTSVINYADLIGREKTDNPKIAEYSEVLLRQSEKLKRLVTDLVDASRASAGDVEILSEKCDARVLVSQADGEYRDKLTQAGLTPVTDVPDTEVFISADSRRMQRVFDNLMNNIIKYAQPGTRVYLSLRTEGSDAVLSFKNTSREMLNIGADELTQRFVRGDSARTSEGSGLGLAIAKDLTALQGGSLTITVDGDLFKAELRFPILL